MPGGVPLATCTLPVGDDRFLLTETLVQEAPAPEKMAEAQHTAMGTRTRSHTHALHTPSQARRKQKGLLCLRAHAVVGL